MGTKEIEAIKLINELLENPETTDEDIKEVIEKNREYDLYLDQIKRLIEVTKDEKYIQQYIRDAKKLGLTFIMSTLVNRITDKQFLKECLDNANEYGIWKYEDLINIVIKLGDKEYTKKYIKENSDLLMLEQISDLICAYGDSEFVKECIKEHNELNLNSGTIQLLIKSIDDDYYVKECIKNAEKVGLSGFGAMSIITEKYLNDTDFVRECIVNRRNNGLRIKDIISLIENTNVIGIDSNYIIDEVLNACEMEEKREFLCKLYKRKAIPRDEFEKCFENGEQNTDELYEKYKKIHSINEELNFTINLEILKNDVLENFDLEKLARITVYPELQQKIIKCSNNEICKEIFKYISNESENWVMALDKLLDNIDEYKVLINNISLSDLGNEDIKKLIQVISQDKNYFVIQSVDDVKDFYNIRKEVCERILNGDDVMELYPLLQNFDQRTLKKFAILEMSYGIDIEEAQNLISKYGQDIEKINTDGMDENSVIAVKAIKIIKNIYVTENLEEKIEKFKQSVKDEIDEPVDYISITDLEAKTINMYAKIYERTLYNPLENPDDYVGEVEYEGKRIKVYKIDPEKKFNMFVRVEGAYFGEGKEPENFWDSLNRPDIEYHGNCKSYIGEDNLAIVKPVKPAEFIYHTAYPKYGYCTIEENAFSLSAPWDIHSDDANTDFSTSSARWDYGHGIEYRIPEELINNTRSDHNESVHERLIFNEEEERFYKDRPQFIVYDRIYARNEEDGIIPEEQEGENDEWRVAKKAAAQMGENEGIIVILDRERINRKEYERYEELVDVFLGKKENVQNLSNGELVEKIVTKYENNMTGMANVLGEFCSKFCIEGREEMQKMLQARIEEICKQDVKSGLELIDKTIQVFENEVIKEYSNVGIKEYQGMDRGYDSLARQLKIRRKEIIQGISNSKKKQLEELYIQNIIGTEELYKVFLDLEHEMDDKKVDLSDSIDMN